MKFEHPMPCAQCGTTFDAWGYTLTQRTSSRWKGLCVVCRESKNLRAINEYLSGRDSRRPEIQVTLRGRDQS